MSLGRHSFVPWVRQGLANALIAPDPGALRASAQIVLDVKGEGAAAPVSGQVSKKVELYGPGDIIGIDARQIVRTEPRHWVTDFEPNYLAFIELYEEDILWRYSAAPPNGARLFPWLALVVLSKDEHEFRAAPGRPRPYIEVKDPDSTLPDPNNAWAWAHVQSNESLSGDDTLRDNEASVRSALESMVARDADLAFSRLVCPRRLEPKTRYHAFLAPLFEPGRLAGLGLDIAAAPSALHFAWRHDYPAGARPEPQNIPVYHHWQFETSERGDFEYLVRLLKPRVADSRIGRRPIDVTDPSENISGVDAPFGAGVLRIGGALQAPFDTLSAEEKAIVQAYENWDQPYPTEFQTQLADFLNLGDEYGGKDAGAANDDASVEVPPEERDDPLVLPPIYGQRYARATRVLNDASGAPLPDRDNWLHETNLDPRHRSTAAFGTKVIQRQQETFMEAAWSQIGDVLAANRRLRFARMAFASSKVWHGFHLTGLYRKASGAFLQTIYPMMRRLTLGASTAKATIARSVVPPVMFSSVFRRATRPAGPLLKRVSVGRAAPEKDIITRVAEGEIAPAPPKVAPPGAPTPADLSPGALDPPRRVKWLTWLLLLLALILVIAALVVGFWFVAIGAVLAAVLLLGRLLLGRSPAPVGLNDDPPAPDGVAKMPKSSDFKLANPFAPGPAPTVTLNTSGFGADSPELARYKLALSEIFAEDRLSPKLAPVRPAEPLDVARFAHDVLAACDPARVLPAKFGALIRIPGRIAQDQRRPFRPVMAYPVIDTPMYKFLLDISDEHFVPNLQFVAQNSITVLETNQPFIEAYMLGLNHEFCRELQWRQYPTDLMAACFRQFWDVSCFLDRSGKSEAALREELRDIPPIHLWRRDSKLGDHNNRDKGGPAENELVLVIRGDLLKRYPNAVIYAQKARWQTKSDGSIDNTLERRLVDLTPDQQDNPPDDLLKTPLYEARAGPDIYFLGFDLTALEARGDTGDRAGDDPGWFFVIKERPGEPRFGFDVERGASDNATWSDLAWTDVALEVGAPFLIAEQNHSLTEPPSTDERFPQWQDDRHVPWTAATNAADLAYILYQLPVMVAVHAAEMLPRNAP